MKRGKMIAALAALGLMLVAGAAQAVPISSVGSGLWADPASWSPAQVPGINDDVTITNGCTNTISTNVALAIASLTIQTNGVLTHLANSTDALGERYKVVLNVAGNLTIDLGGQINADGKGYVGVNGPGKSVSGAGHGGVSSTTVAPYVGGTTYGSITAPTNLGSGASFSETMGGGGAIILTVAGTSAISGLVSATGQGHNNYITASGGSVFLTTGTLTGNGTIRANGGNGATQCSGGGGRVAVILTNSADFDAVKMQAYAGAPGVEGNPGAGGTVYLQTTNHAAGRGKLVVDYNNILPAYTANGVVTLQNGLAASSNAFAEIVLTNGAVYGLDTNDTLDVTGTTIQGNPADGNDGIYLMGGTLIAPAVFGFTNCFIWLGTTNSTFNPATSLTVGTNATMRIAALWTINCPMTVTPGGVMYHSGNITNYPAVTNLTINGNLSIQSGGIVTANVIVVNGNLNINSNGVLTHLANSTDALGERYQLILNVTSNLTIDAGGQINVDSKGYIDGNGPGRPSVYAGNGGGAGYGGMGGRGTQGEPGTTYGSITAPTNCGSGGDQSLGSRCAGGGAIRLLVTGASTVNGVISASAVLAASYYAGGSGGSVFLTTATLAGNGTIKANGGNMTFGATGGGGRIAVMVTNSTGFGGVRMEAYSGAGATLGAPGTIYLETLEQGSGKGTLVIDASNMVSTVTTLIGSNVTDAFVGTVIITNKAVLQIDTNQSLTVNGSWTNAATFIASSNSTVIFTSTNAATVAGSNTFYNLTCTNASKTVFFQAGKTNTVTGLLKLGAPSTAQAVSLQSTADGNQWYVTLATNGGIQQIAQVAVKDSNAGGGRQLVAGLGSVSLGNNTNWSFPDVTLPQLSNVGLQSRVATSADVAGLLVANGETPATVYLYWSTTDGTTNASTWTVGGSVSNLGGRADGESFTNTIGPLVSNTVYYWNYSASNSAGTFWGATAGSPSFKTFGSPGLNNAAGATDNNILGVTLNGNLTNGVSAHVYFLLGTAEGFWSTTNDVGTRGEGLFSNRVTGLSGGTTYYYTSYATNGYGTAQATPSMVFTTVQGTVNAWTGGGTSSNASEAANWSLGVPAANHTIVLYGTTNKPMTWDAGSNGLPDTVAGWQQTAVYTGTVTILTRYGASSFTNFTVSGDATLSGGTWTHLANAGGETNRLSINVGGNLTVDAGGQINADGKGYFGINGPGKSAGGAGYGGVSPAGASAVGTTYGSITAPTNLGSGAQIAFGPNLGGGGAILLTVAGTSAINGLVSATADTSAGYNGASGGSVFLTTGVLTGNGTLRANGGSYATQCSGGGGRVAVILTNSADFGAVKMQAYAGAPGVEGNPGAAGTVYLQTQAQGPGQGTLVIDASNIVSLAGITTLVSSNVRDTVVGTVIITNKAILAIDTNQSLTVKGSWLRGTNTSFIANTNSTVVFAGTNTATIMNTNTFYNLTAGAAGKTIFFEAGKTNGVNGMLIFQKNTTLLSTQNGVQWWLHLSSSTGTQQVGRVIVKDSNAGSGQTIYAGVGSLNLLNNVNWVFPPGGTMFVIR